MTDHTTENPSRELADARVRAMFKNHFTVIADDGFVDAVAKRVRRRVWSRKIVLGCFAVVGGAIGFVPMRQIGTEIAQRIATFSVDWQSLATLSFDWSSLGAISFDWQSAASWPAQIQWLIVGIAVAVLTPLIIGLLDS